MDSGSAPAAPDPVTTASAQGQANSDAARLSTALNRPNQVTPFGSLTWSHGGTGGAPVQGSASPQLPPGTMPNSSGYNITSGGDGLSIVPNAGGTQVNGSNDGTNITPQDNWTSTITLDPRVQSIVDNQLGIQQGLQGATQHQLQNVSNTFANPIDMGALPAAGSAAGAQGAAMTRYSNPQPLVDQTMGTAGQATGVARQGLGELSSTMGQPLPDASEAARQQVINSMYGQATSRLDPQYQQQEAQMRSDLMNRGIVEGSDAWKTQLDNLGRQKNDAYTSAMNSAIQNGGVEQTRLLNNQLAVRDQGMQEGTTGLAAGATANADARSALGTQVAVNQGIDQSATSQFQNQNTQRQDALTEQQQQRAQAINQLTALMSGQQTTMPQFSNGQSGGNVAAAPYLQAIQQQYQGQLAGYNANVASNNSNTSAAATMAAAFMMM